MSEAPSDAARGWAQQGETQRQQGQYTEAIAAFSAAIAAHPTYSWALARRGESYQALGQHEAALRDFTNALDLRPDYTWALAHRGAVYQLLQRWDEALADLNAALALQPAYAWAIMQRARTYEMMRFYQAGLGDFQRAVALDPTVVNEHLATENGLLHALAGRYPEAIRHYESALDENPDNLMARYGLLVVRCQMQGYAAVQAEVAALRAHLLTQLASAAPTAEQLYSLSGLAALADNRDEAFDYLTRTLALQPARLQGADHDLAWQPLRADPRYRALATRTLPDGAGAVASGMIVPPLTTGVAYE